MKKQFLIGAAFSLGTAAFFGANTFAADISNIQNETDLRTCMTQTSAAICTLGADVSVTSTILTTSDITLNLGTYTINADNSFTNPSQGVITVEHGSSLTINGNGKIVSGTNATSAVRMTNNTDNSKTAILTVNGGTLEGRYYAITGNGSTGRDNTNITINGGTIKGTEAEDNTAIFHPQKGNLTINGGTLIGASGIIFKSGVLNVNGGQITANGTYTANPICSNNGFNQAGAALQIESNTPPYSGDMSLSFNGGTLTSTNGIAFHEYTCPSTEASQVKSISFTNVNFTGAIQATEVSNLLSGSSTWKKSITSGSVVSSGAFDGKALVITKSANVSGLPKNYDSIIDSTYQVTTEEQTAINALGITGFNQAAAYNIIITDENGDPVTNPGLINFTLPLPTNISPVANGFTRNFYVIRIHDGVATKLNSTVNADGTISFGSDLFSTFVIGYVDTKTPVNVNAPNSGFAAAESSSAATNIAPFAAIVAVATLLFAIKKFTNKEEA